MLSSLSVQAPREQVCIATKPIKSLPSQGKTLKPTTTFVYHIVGLTMLTETRKKISCENTGAQNRSILLLKIFHFIVKKLKNNGLVTPCSLRFFKTAFVPAKKDFSKEENEAPGFYDGSKLILKTHSYFHAPVLYYLQIAIEISHKNVLVHKNWNAPSKRTGYHCKQQKCLLLNGIFETSNLRSIRCVSYKFLRQKFVQERMLNFVIANQ